MLEVWEGVFPSVSVVVLVVEVHELDCYQIARTSIETAETRVCLTFAVERQDELAGSILTVQDVATRGRTWYMSTQALT